MSSEPFSFFYIFFGDTVFAKTTRTRQAFVPEPSHAILLQCKCNIYANCSQDLTEASALA